MAEVPLGARLKLIGGARYESDKLDVDAASTLGTPVSTSKLWNDWLPSLALNVKLTDAQQLRLSASRTLARPEYRELSPIISRDVIGGENVQGNENLERTNVTNLDLRWEMYPSAGEALSVGAVREAVHQSDRARLRLGERGHELRVLHERAGGRQLRRRARAAEGAGSARLASSTPLAVFANATVMESRIKLAENTTAAATNLSRRMVGQAPYVLNAGLTYTSRWRRHERDTAVQSRRRADRRGWRQPAAGCRGAVAQRARLSRFRSLLLNGATLRFDLKNLLDSPYDTRQGTVVREYYRAGRMVQLGVQLNR